MESQYGTGMMHGRTHHHPVILSLYIAEFIVALCLATVMERGALAVLLLVLLILRHQSIRQGLVQIRVFVPFLILYCLIGSLFSADVTTGRLLWQTSTWPWLHPFGLHRLAMTTTSLQTSVNRAITLFTLMSFMVFIGRNLRLEDTTFWLERTFPRLALTLGIIVQFFPTLLSERDRIATLFAVRSRTHLSPQPISFVRRQLRSAEQTATVYRVLLLNALDRSWTFAESLYVRGYGASERTRYKHVRWQSSDTRQLICLLIAAVCLLCVAVAPHWKVQPRNFSDVSEVLWFIGFGSLAFAGYIMRGGKK